MAVEVDPSLLASMAEDTGACHVQLTGVASDVAERALAAAAAALFRIPHPEEPDDPLPSFASDVERLERGARFWFDVADAEAYDGLLEQIVAVLVQAIEDAGVDAGRLEPALRERGS